MLYLISCNSLFTLNMNETEANRLMVPSFFKSVFKIIIEKNSFCLFFRNLYFRFAELIKTCQIS